MNPQKGTNSDQMNLACAVCTQARATMYCVNDDAYLCTVCDEEHHGNPLGAKHERRPISDMFGMQENALSGTSLDDVAVVPQMLPGTDDMFLFSDIPDIKADDGLDALNISDFDDLFTVPDGFDAFMPNGLEEETPVMVPQLVPQMVPQQTSMVPCVDFNDENVEMKALELIESDLEEEKVDKAPKMVPSAGTQATKRRRAHRSSYVGYGNDDYEYSFMEDEEDDKEDDTDFYVAPRRMAAGTRRMSSRRSPQYASARDVVPCYGGAGCEEPELTREERVARYLAKRARRSFQKTIRYQSRKAYAEIRPRIKGRFVSHEEYAEYMAAQKQQVEQVVPGC